LATVRWLFATVAVLVAGGLGAFAIYTWGWRENSTAPAPDSRVSRLVRESKQARIYLAAVYELCAYLARANDPNNTPPNIYTLVLGLQTQCARVGLESQNVDLPRPFP
jgi:hypothetical protein